ncbi:hypothetical protein TUN205_11843 [Pyrenophora tritici-repentis]|nr:hypothetical protein TUN205_11843 [Pyrenophora tritici-repentis]
MGTDEDGGEATLQVGSAIPDEDAQVSLSLSVDYDAAWHARVVSDTTLCQSLLLEPPRTETLPDGSAARITEMIESAKGNKFDNPIVLDDDDDGTQSQHAKLLVTRFVWCQTTAVAMALIGLQAPPQANG